jgi:tetratricopeptide (TPR) repeat protein
MGEVWHAADGEGRTAALKLLRGAGLEPELARRFAREAETLAALDHPNVVRALDHGQADGGGLLFVAMELLQGQSLDARLRAGPLAVGEAVRVARAAAAGLGAAHAHGLVHRDVKPGNLFLCGDGNVKVLDFGIALEVDAEATRLTQTGALMGTPSYMAPEQATGEGRIDERTDVWGLGAVMHRALSGQRPFWAGGNALAEMLRIVRDEPLPLPAHVPAAVAAVVRRALQKDPAQRFATMRDFAAALALDDGALAAAPAAATAQAASAPHVDARTGASAGPYADTDTETSAGATPVSLRDEVRLVTALLAEGVRDRAAADALSYLVEGLGGAGTELAGGRFVGVFGGAEWAGDEPARAVRAALAARAHARWIAVGTGKALRVEGEATLVTGAALFAAEAVVRRLESSGAEGLVGACPETRRRVERAFEVNDDGEVRAARAAALRGGGDGPEDGTVPLLGRASELRRLVELVERTAGDGRAEAALVVGPPGIGKSRLLDEVRRQVATAASGARWLEGRGESTRAFSSHAMIAGVLRACAALPEGSPLEQARALIEALAGDAAVPAAKRRGTVEFIGELLGVPFPENVHLATARAQLQVMSDRIRLALGDLFEGFCAQGPVVLALDDVQWADGASLALVEFLLLRLEARPFAVLAWARPELLAARPDTLPGAERVSLRELSARDAAVIVERILGRAEPAVVERAAGNPYFAEELARAVKDGADAGALPPTVEGAVQGRLDALDPREKDLLKRVAVLGRRFWSEAAAALGEPEAPRVLRTLRRRDLVVPSTEPRLAGRDEWLFRQSVVQQVAYGMLTEAQRRTLHGLAAAWLGAQPDAPPGEVAEHHECAGQPALARPLWARASAQAHDRGDSAEVVAHAGRALADVLGVAPLPAAEAYALGVRRATALHWLGRVDDEEQALEWLEALERTTDGGGVSAAARAEARMRRGMQLSRRGRFTESCDAWREMAALAAGDDALVAWARAGLAAQYVHLGRADEAEEEARGAVALARETTNGMVRALCVAVSAYVAGLHGDHARSLAAFRVAADEFTASGAVRSATASVVSAAGLLRCFGEVGGARDLLEQALVRARSLGLRETEGFALQALGAALAQLGEVEAGRAALARCLELAQAMGHPVLTAAALASRSVLAREAGDPTAALADADAALQVVRRERLQLNEASCATVRAQALLDLGRAAEALPECERALAARAAAGGMEEGEIDLLLCHHDVLAALGRTADAATAGAAARVRLDELLARIDDDHLRRTFRENVPANRRLLQLTLVAS